MIHKHHIIPRYEGGSDFSENIVELTVTQHAMWHFAEWQRKGRWQDKLAWQGLAGIIPHSEAIRQVFVENGKKSHEEKDELGRSKRAVLMRSKVSKEACAKGGRMASHREKPIRVFNETTSYIFISIQEAARVLSLSAGNLHGVLNKRRKQHLGWKAEYLR